MCLFVYVLLCVTLVCTVCNLLARTSRHVWRNFERTFASNLFLSAPLRFGLLFVVVGGEVLTVSVDSGVLAITA